MYELTLIETRRQVLQAKNDAMRTLPERNKLGQFATPIGLALDILNYAITLMPDTEKIRFLDPAFGTGSFFSAGLQTFSDDRISAASGYEIDKNYINDVTELWADANLTLYNKDFTREIPPETDIARFNLLICNPPYVRHHHLSKDDKKRLKRLAEEVIGVKISGLAGLYCYFLILSHDWMTQDGIAGWLIPSEFMDVNYGKAVKHYLLNKVTLLRIHRFDPKEVQFNDALVSSAVVWFRKTPPKPGHMVEFTFGNSLANPGINTKISILDLQNESKWSKFPFSEDQKPYAGVRLSDLFSVKRGLATGNNNFFILNMREIAAHQLPMAFFKPILPSPRRLEVNEIIADENGNPLIKEELFLLDCRLPEEEVAEKYPKLWDYLKSGQNNVALRYLCKNRSPWYRQEDRQPAQFLCTYMGREGKKRPFRFILNNSIAIAANSYLMLYPKPELSRALASNPELARKIWMYLNSIDITNMLAEGRVYGGGLYKIEPKELANLPVGSILMLLKDN